MLCLLSEMTIFFSMPYGIDYIRILLKNRFAFNFVIAPYFRIFHLLYINLYGIIILENETKELSIMENVTMNNQKYNKEWLIQNKDSLTNFEFMKIYYSNVATESERFKLIKAFELDLNDYHNTQEAIEDILNQSIDEDLLAEKDDVLSKWGIDE